MSINPRFKLLRGSTSTQKAHPQIAVQQQQHLHETPHLTKSQNRYNSSRFEATSSILSDYDDLEVIDDVNEESLYVLFNPISKPKNESDILSLTNTSKGESEVDTDQEYEANDVQKLKEDEEEEDDDDVDVHTDTEKLSNKINSWYNSNIVTSSQEIDENVASWNLDEDEELSSSNALRLPQQQPEQQLLEESKRLLTEFYGDDLFKCLDQEDIAKVKGFHNMMDVKRFLLEKDVAPTDSLLKQLIYKILYVKDKSSSFDTSHHTFNLGNTNYINYLMEDVHQKQLQPLPFGGSFLGAPSTFSDTNTGGGSSLIMCGGVGFGDKTSWNDI